MSMHLPTVSQSSAPRFLSAWLRRSRIR